MDWTDYAIRLLPKSYFILQDIVALRISWDSTNPQNDIKTARRLVYDLLSNSPTILPPCVSKVYVIDCCA